ncbi:STAS domain-containing protein [Aquimarina hainanensis]|uniref:STAS domain-containing protein n=1 Tax=Aquimarina hainanensis TaxID=1578017 RepID=A0ABW5N9K3_9FLAO
MKLHISNNLGTYEIIGNFTSKNTHIVKDHFDYLLNHYDEIVISLNKVKIMDVRAIKVLQVIYLKALKRGKVLFVLGKDNFVITSLFDETGMNHIFRDDY